MVVYEQIEPPKRDFSHSEVRGFIHGFLLGATYTPNRGLSPIRGLSIYVDDRKGKREVALQGKISDDILRTLDTILKERYGLSRV